MDLTHDLIDSIVDKTGPLSERRLEVMSAIQFCADMTIVNRSFNIDIAMSYPPAAMWVHRLLTETFGFVPAFRRTSNGYVIRLHGVKRAQQCGLLDSQCKPITRLPSDSYSATAFSGMLRGAFLGCGSLHADKDLTITFRCPNHPAAHALTEAAHALGVDKNDLLTDTNNTVTAENNAALTLLRRIGAGAIVSRRTLTHYATPHIRKDHLLVGANTTRTLSASERTRTEIQNAIDTLGAENIPTDLLHAAQLRLTHPQASLAELAHHAHTTKHTIAGRLRRLLTRKFVARESPASLVRGWSASILFPGWPLPGVAAWPPLVGARHYRDWYECRGW